MTRFEIWKERNKLTDDEFKILNDTRFYEVEYNKDTFRKRFFKYHPNVKDIEKYLGRDIPVGVLNSDDVTYLNIDGEIYVEPIELYTASGHLASRTIISMSNGEYEKDTYDFYLEVEYLERIMFKYAKMWSEVMEYRRNWNRVEIVDDIRVFRIYKDDMIFMSRRYPKLRNIEPLRVNRIPYYIEEMLVDGLGGKPVDDSEYVVFDDLDFYQYILRAIKDVEGKNLMGKCMGTKDGGKYEIR